MEKTSEYCSVLLIKTLKTYLWILLLLSSWGFFSQSFEIIFWYSTAFKTMLQSLKVFMKGHKHLHLWAYTVLAHVHQNPLTVQIFLLSWYTWPNLKDKIWHIPQVQRIVKMYTRTRADISKPDTLVYKTCIRGFLKCWIRLSMWNKFHHSTGPMRWTMIIPSPYLPYSAYKTFSEKSQINMSDFSKK